MDLRFSAEEEAFRNTVRAWLDKELSGEFAPLRGRGGPGDEDYDFEARKKWERRLGEAGWIGLGYPGRAASFWEQVIWHEEYARADAPGRVGHIGEQLLGPTLVEYGTDAQKERFLPAIMRGEELWCQGYSEPNAGSDLANVETRAILDGDRWVIEGQKVWTSLALHSDWCFVLARTSREAKKHAGLSYLLVPMKQPGIEVRPIVQITGSSEFCEVFFEGATTPSDHVVGAVGDGWKVALYTLMVERGVSTLGQQIRFENELNLIISRARENGRAEDPTIRQRLVDAWIGLRVMRLNALRTLDSSGRGSLINKLYWATWHRDLGELAMDVLGERGEIVEGELDAFQRLFLFSRADTIYAGSNEIQKNIIAERGLGLPK